MIHLLRNTLFAGFISALSAATAFADEILMPFVLASTSNDDVKSVASEVKSKLAAGGFEIVGEYSPYKNADIINLYWDNTHSFCRCTAFCFQ